MKTVEMRWKADPKTTTKPHVLQYRQREVNTDWVLPDGNVDPEWGPWEDVPIEVET